MEGDRVQEIYSVQVASSDPEENSHSLSVSPEFDASNLSGVDAFEQEIVPELAELVKSVERVGRAKAVAKQAEKLNRVELQKQLEDVVRASTEAGEKARSLLSMITPYKVVATAPDQERWTRVFVEACHGMGRQVEGQFPTFRVFPVEIKADLANDAVYLNNRMTRSLHPKAVASLVDIEITRLSKERFNAVQFARALVRASEVLLAERRVQAKSDNASSAVLLKQVHALLAVRTGSSAGGYSLNQFAFDLYRVRTQSGLVVDGNRLVFHTTRLGKDAIVIPLPGGQKEILGSLEVVAQGSDSDD